MSSFRNSKKESFLKSIPKISLEDSANDLTNRCKFNFSYLDESQSPSKKLEDFTHEQILKILNKLKDFSRMSLFELKNLKIGSGKHKWNLFDIYGAFPLKSDYFHPTHVPHQAEWARFRLEYDFRLVGFVVPTELHQKLHNGSKQYYDQNTFYIVFFDVNHSFYK